MIVASGLLLVLAAVLLITGAVTGSLGLVYGAVAACLLSGLLLALGVLQRREQPPAAALPVEQDEDELDGEQPAGQVLVAAGQPRYHLRGCPELGGDAAQQADVVEARERGLLPCGTCRPDAALAAAARERELQRTSDEQPGAVRLPPAGGVPDPVVVDGGRLHRAGCPLVREAADPVAREQADALGLPSCERCRP